MKKLLPLLLSVIVVISIFAGVALSSNATDANPVYYLSGDYTYVIVGSTDAKIVGYSGADTEVVIPEALDEYAVTSIDDFAFSQNLALKCVTIPSTVVSVSEYAFLETELDCITFLNIECEIFDSEYTVSSSAVIRGYDNSTAQLYAEKYERAFESLGDIPVTPTEVETETPTELIPTENATEVPTEKPFDLGDVDGDGDVSVIDATAIQLHVASIQLIPDDMLPYGDADKDGDVSVLDATQIQLFVAQIIETL